MMKDVEVSRESRDAELRIVGRELETAMQLVRNVCDVLECFLDVRHILPVETSFTAVYV